jgi:hypothetical protein
MLKEFELKKKKMIDNAPKPKIQESEGTIGDNSIESVEANPMKKLMSKIGFGLKSKFKMTKKTSFELP